MSHKVFTISDNHFIGPFTIFIGVTPEPLQEEWRQVLLPVFNYISVDPNLNERWYVACPAGNDTHKS